MRLVGLGLLFAGLLHCGASVRVLREGARSGAIVADDAAAADRFLRSRCNNGYTVTDERPTESGRAMTYRCEDQLRFERE